MFEYHTRDIGGDICYYKRKNGTQLWSFINEKEYKNVNTGDMETIEYKEGGSVKKGSSDDITKTITDKSGVGKTKSKNSYTPKAKKSSGWFSGELSFLNW